MFATRKAAGAALALAIVAVTAPAAAQERGRTSRTAEEIAREIRDAANAVGVVTDAVNDSVRGVRWRGPERFAIDRCTPSVERYGRMRVDDVRRYGRRSWRVYGTADPRGGSYGYGSRYAPRAFTCTVRDDGRVKLKTKRIRY
jgi:hypothetical protein